MTTTSQPPTTGLPFPGSGQGGQSSLHGPLQQLQRSHPSLRGQPTPDSVLPRSYAARGQQPVLPQVRRTPAATPQVREYSAQVVPQRQPESEFPVLPYRHISEFEKKAEETKVDVELFALPASYVPNKSRVEDLIAYLIEDTDGSLKSAQDALHKVMVMDYLLQQHLPDEDDDEEEVEDRAPVNRPPAAKKAARKKAAQPLAEISKGG